MKQKLTFVMLLIGLCAHAQTANPYEVVMDEIMADPAPVVGLPNTEFIELRNVSAKAFNLNGWQTGDASGFATISQNFMLQPDSFVVICANSAVAALRIFGTTIGVSNFPSLDNDGDQLYLRSKEGRIIHAVNYAAGWYQNAVKNQGGWTLEMIDTKNPCIGFSNWIASNDSRGGTPGKKNSVDAINKDTQPPMLMNAFAADSANIILLFNEPLDSLQASSIANYTISDGIGMPLSAWAIAPLFNKVQLSIGGKLARNKIYNITAINIADCSGNAIGAYNKAKLGRASDAGFTDIIINEILFNPKADGADYIELYNRSNTIVDLKDCYIANRSARAGVGTVKQLSAESRLLFPAEYMVVTADAAAVKKTIPGKGSVCVYRK